MTINDASFLYHEYETATSYEIATAACIELGKFRRSIGRKEVIERDAAELKARGRRRKAFDTDLIAIMQKRIAERRQKERAA